jgi:hypothetical protein
MKKRCTTYRANVKKEGKVRRTGKWKGGGDTVATRERTLLVEHTDVWWVLFRRELLGKPLSI